MAELTAEQAQEREDKRQAWVQQHFQKANRFLSEKGIIPERVVLEECRYLVPLVAIWKLESKRPKKQTFWVISGDLPSDYVDVTVASTAREAIRHFSMTWQLKAENINSSAAANDPTQAQFAALLIARAESLYNLYNDEKMWQQPVQ